MLRLDLVENGFNDRGYIAVDPPYFGFRPRVIEAFDQKSRPVRLLFGDTGNRVWIRPISSPCSKADQSIVTFQP